MGIESSVADSVSSGSQEATKRMCDVAVALAIALVTWPLALITGLAIWLDSAGPIIYWQDRVGLNGAAFTLYKFRSMRADAESASGAVWAKQDDPRMTRVGRVVRKFRIDELPQLYNVLRGDMSIVGPRPERTEFVDSLSNKIALYRRRHLVKPGLTGLAQINLPYSSTLQDVQEKLRYDLHYIKTQSLTLDCQIMFQTIKVVMLGQGAR
jgi:exopolysaccharide biosynthesis polyprenyl glycosylphosphotransferase